MDAVLSGIYFDTNNPACFSNVTALYREAKKIFPKLRQSDVKRWLAKQEAYTLHKPARKKFIRNSTIVGGIDDQWEVDLADLSMLKRYNDNYKYLLQCIDIFSRHGWSVPMKTKTCVETSLAFEKILKTSGRKPLVVSSDAGKEFLGKDFQQTLKKYSIHYFVSTSDNKCPYVERWNRTIKTRMWRYFTHSNTFRYVDILPHLVHAYNNSIHRIIKCCPAEVTKETEPLIHERLRKWQARKTKPFAFKVGDKVRLSKNKGMFEKGYLSNYTREIFEIYYRAARPLNIYKVKDANGEKVKGSFYEHQLQRVNEPDVYKVEKILRWRKLRNGKKQAYVRWLGYGPNFDQWVDESEIVQL